MRYNDGYSPDKELVLLLRWVLIFVSKFKSFRGNFKFESLDFSVQFNNHFEMCISGDFQCFVGLSVT